jgi:hypothetical protein
VAHYLDPSTEAKITAVVERELLGSNLRMLVEMPNSGLVPLLEHDKVDDLRRMFGLLRRGGVQGGVAAMGDIMVLASLRTSPVSREGSNASCLVGAARVVRMKTSPLTGSLATGVRTVSGGASAGDGQGAGAGPGAQQGAGGVRAGAVGRAGQV